MIKKMVPKPYRIIEVSLVSPVIDALGFKIDLAQGDIPLQARFIDRNPARERAREGKEKQIHARLHGPTGRRFFACPAGTLDIRQLCRII
jgi:hypothetical protein